MERRVTSCSHSLLWGFLFSIVVGIRAAGADPVRLTFEGLGATTPGPCVERVANFYNGGFGIGVCSPTGHGPGPDWGIVFSDNSLALIDSDAGGNGNFGGEPSPNTALFMNPSTPGIMNVARGFSGSVGLYYSAAARGSLRVYAGLNGTGPLLGELFLPVTPAAAAPDPTGFFSPFVPIELSFTGRARSAVFDGAPDSIVFDDVTVDIGAPVPEPGTLLLIVTGALGVIRPVWRVQNPTCRAWR